MLTCRARNKGISIPTPGAKVTGLAPDDTGAVSDPIHMLV